MSARPATPFHAVPFKQVRESVYSAFLYGHGAPAPDESWGFDLGVPLQYTKRGTVHRQEFENGVALANVGTEPVRVELETAYVDLSGIPRTTVVLPPQSGDVLRRRVPVPAQPASKGWRARG